ncbi:MAG TPA: cytochrome-c oxidase, cbb3-type subunit III [Rudaea sp.]|nr:cytochrome-c oxidase, cbb3-type subunit III [Rudaea sp.]
MSAFWSDWVMVLVTFNLGFALILFLWGLRVRIPTQPDGTSGHVWAHGLLREGVRNLPLWWVLLSAAVFVGAFAYLALYPGFGNSAGRLGWTSHAELATDTAANDALLEPEFKAFATRSVEELAKDESALRIGNRVFADNCAACHGSQGRGNALIGAPNLTDADWLYGGDGEKILQSILGGRHGAMPPWGAVLHDDGVEKVANYVLSLSGAAHDAAKAASGKPLFVTCSACHGAEGKGNPVLGAPNLTDAIWLYGGDLATVEKSIRDGRSGVMPAWRQRLSDGEARTAAAYVYSLSHHDAAAR